MFSWLRRNTLHKVQQVGDWLRCICHDLFGHPGMEIEDYCLACGSTKALCDVCWHHYTLNLQRGTDA